MMDFSNSVLTEHPNVLSKPRQFVIVIYEDSKYKYIP